jgi:colicin import membrane protein
MVVVSVLFHLAIFSVVLFVPEAMPTRPFHGVVYEVNLVEMPAGAALKSGRAKTVRGKEGKGIVKKGTKAKRIKEVKKKKKPLVIAKRTLKPKKSTTKKPKVSASQLIDRAISRVEKKVASEGEPHIDRAISKLEKKGKGRYGLGATGGQPVSGIPIQIYQMEVEDWIKSHWSYPVALPSRKDLEAVVVLMVKRDGSILKTEIKKRSSDDMFDQSVIKAIERSDPLPPFPEGYRKSYDEIEINFNLKELEEY